MIIMKHNTLITALTIGLVSIITVCSTLDASAIKDDSANSDFSNADKIAEIGGLNATCQTNDRNCIINVDSDHNPYDVTWNYGKDYNNYIDRCDWSLVFDANYYMNTFPLLAMLYHYDEELLLEHFQTVGIHEGRQGCANFNLGAYYTNNTSNLYNSFGDNYECYYIYYMLNYYSEKNINTISRNDGKEVYPQYTIKLTKLQAMELNGVNSYRKNVGAANLVMDSEIMALSNYRAYLNVHDEWERHDWFKSDENWYSVTPYLGTIYGSENTITGRFIISYNSLGVPADNYRTSNSHYEAMIDTRYTYLGASNLYTGRGIDGVAKTSQFDMFFRNELATSTIGCAK